MSDDSDLFVPESELLSDELSVKAGILVSEYMIPPLMHLINSYRALKTAYVAAQMQIADYESMLADCNAEIAALEPYREIKRVEDSQPIYIK